MNRQKDAPRDSASRPSAPVPANRSSTRAPSSLSAKRCARTLNSASRVRSVVGRIDVAARRGQRPPAKLTADDPHPLLPLPAAGGLPPLRPSGASPRGLPNGVPPRLAEGRLALLRLGVGLFAAALPLPSARPAPSRHSTLRARRLDRPLVALALAAARPNRRLRLLPRTPRIGLLEAGRPVLNRARAPADPAWSVSLDSALRRGRDRCRGRACGS